MSHNPYADSGFKNPEVWLQKADIVLEVRRAMKARRLTPSRAARIARMPLPEYREIISGHFGDVDVMTLVECARRLGHDIEVKYRPVDPDERRRGRITLLSDCGPIVA